MADDAIQTWQERLVAVKRRFGWPGVIIALIAGLALFAWWEWKDVRDLAGVQDFVAAVRHWFDQPGDPNRLTIAIATIDGDEGDHIKRVLVTNLEREVPEVVLLTPHITIEESESISDEVTRARTEEEVRKLGQKMKADAVLWGSVSVIADTPPQLNLHWTNIRRPENLNLNNSKKISAFETYDLRTGQLPESFRSQLGVFLALIAETKLSSLTPHMITESSVERLKPFINQAERLLQEKQDLFDPATRASMQLIIAEALIKVAPVSIEGGRLFRDALDYLASAEQVSTSQANRRRLAQIKTMRAELWTLRG
jgi:hypothetical protein